MQLRRLNLSYIFHIILLCCCLAPKTNAQELGIGLYTSLKPTQVLVSVQNGSYKLKANEQEIATIATGEPLYISYGIDNLFIKKNNEDLGPYTYLEFEAISANSVVKLLCTQPLAREQWYEGKLTLRPYNNYIQLVNKVQIESYVGGVVEAETGAEQTLEFYKMQGTICRTFALANLQKHAADGFNLCDQVHCQVYKGKAKSNPNIMKAVNETAGFVVVDRSLNLVDAVFHSNCGGQTLNSEEYWKERVSYLRAVSDPHCSEGLQARWRVNIPKDKWLNYLQGKFNFPIEDTSILEAACNYKPDIRSQYFISASYGISMKRLRSDWNLRSTYFEVKDEGENIVLIGRGFGHGVGMCQEGAMKMARSGKDYSEILHFYFKDVFIIPRDQLGYIKGF